MERKTSSTIELQSTNERDIERRDVRARDRERVLLKLGEVSVLLGVILAVWLLVCLPTIIIFSTGPELSEVRRINLTLLFYETMNNCSRILILHCYCIPSYIYVHAFDFVTVLYNIMLLIVCAFHLLLSTDHRLSSTLLLQLTTVTVPVSPTPVTSSCAEQI